MGLRSHRRAEMPAGYPTAYERTVRLGDGRQVAVRPIVPSDAHELAEAIRTADAATRHARFLGGPPPMTAAILDSLTNLDHTTRFALVAIAEGRGIAVARYVALERTDDRVVEAEVAVAVAPDFRRVGLATVLIQMLGHRAQECGIAQFTALFFAQNRPVMHLARGAQATVAIAQGLAELEATVPRLWEDSWPRSGMGRSERDASPS